MTAKSRRLLRRIQRKRLDHRPITTVAPCIPQVTHTLIKELQVTLTLVAGIVREHL